MVLIYELKILDTRVPLLDALLNFSIFNIFFVTFCILIVINGSNFLDGLNTLVIGYYSLVCFFLILMSNNFNLFINQNINLLLVFLLVIYFFNFFEKLYLGDSGSYLIGFYISFFVIDFVLMNNFVSPYIICFFLWYPAFENLFSILRRVLSKNKVDEADQFHLHQMVYNFLINKKIINPVYVNTLVANLINIYNFIIFLYFYKFYSNTKIIIIGIVLNIIIYLSIYFFIKKNIYKN